MAEWLTPKTDWRESDYFNIEDYNRIIGNISYLKSLADELFVLQNSSSLGDEKGYASMIYASEMNNVEDALESLNLETYGFEIGEKQTFKANGSTLLWSEFNRIESAILLLYKTMKAHKDSLPRLAFSLGGQKGVRV